MATYRGVEIDLSVPSGMREAARRALRWKADGRAGMTQVGMATARQLARGGDLSPSKWRQIARYFPRHEVDKRATGFNAGEAGFPRPGRVAWDGWGGDAGQSAANRVVNQLNRIDGRAA